jgi:hypothetical protein
VHPGSGIVEPIVSPVPISDRPPDAEPRHVSTPAAARPGATTVGGVVSLVVVLTFAGSLMLTMDIAPDVVALWAYAGALTASRRRIEAVTRI